MANVIDRNNIPAHVAIMMDGNGRWAKRKLLPREAGHNAGARALKALVPKAEELGIKCLTVFAFSTENWKRSDDEIKSLMDLMRAYIRDYVEEAEKNNIVMRVVGDVSRLDGDLRGSIARLEAITEHKTGMRLNIAINYGGRDDIVRAARKTAEACIAGQLTPNAIDENFFSSCLDTAGLPEVDLFIRTGGDLRLSNFLLYQFAYAELYFTDALWPDFDDGRMRSAIIEYQQRNRRYGGRK